MDEAYGSKDRRWISRHTQNIVRSSTQLVGGHRAVLDMDQAPMGKAWTETLVFVRKSVGRRCSAGCL